MTFYAETPKPRSLASRIIGWLVFVSITGAGLFLAIAPTPYLVEQAGPAYNVLSTIAGKPMITVTGKTTYPTTGDLDMLTVTMKGDSTRGASWFDVFLAKFDSSVAIINKDDVYPPGWDDAKLNEEADMMMLDSQANAKAAALNLLDIPFTSSVKVTSVTKSGPAGKILKAGDTLLTVQGEKATGIDQVRAFVKATKGESQVELGIDRNGKRSTVYVLPKLIDEQWRMGIYVQSVPEFPFKIDIEVGNVGGPSGGQILTLAIYDKLTPGSLTGGQKIAGTGTITPEGEIGPIGGIRQKMYGALRAGAKWFLAPSENCDEVIGHVPDGIRVIKVSNIQDSLKAVKAIASSNGTASLPSCTK
jgi:PDZ domain-containing protein